MEQMVEGLALQRPPLPVLTLSRQVSRIAEGRGEKPPSREVVDDIARRLAADRMALAHAGTRADSNESGKRQQENERHEKDRLEAR
jgi:putative transposase